MLINGLVKAALAYEGEAPGLARDQPWRDLSVHISLAALTKHHFLQQLTIISNCLYYFFF